MELLRFETARIKGDILLLALFSWVMLGDFLLSLFMGMLFLLELPLYSLVCLVGDVLLPTMACITITPPFGEYFSKCLEQIRDVGSKSKNPESIRSKDGDIDPAGNISPCSLSMTTATPHYDIYLPTNLYL